MLHAREVIAAENTPATSRSLETTVGRLRDRCCKRLD